MSPNPTGRLDGHDLVPAGAIVCARKWPYIDNFGFGKDSCSVLLGQVEVVQIQRVLRSVTAAHHATPATTTGAASRAFAAEEWVCNRMVHCLAIGCLQDAHPGGVERVSAAGRICRVLQQVIGSAQDFVFNNAQHA